MKKKNLYFKFLGFLIKKGKKLVANKILAITFKKISLKLDIPISSIISQIFLKLNTFVEVKKIKMKRNIHYIPFPIKYSRRLHLISNWILLTVKNNNQRISFDNKLLIELSNTLLLKSSNALNLKKLNERQAIIHKANTHFRWN